MTKKKSTKRALISSLLILAMCFTMLAGTTFAWFTDSVVSGNNIIKSGKLDIEFEWADGDEDPDAATWTDASTGAIFDYDLWEPGYTQVRHIRIANKGNLALKYKVQISAVGTVSDLAKVIDVYYIDPAQQIADRAAFAAIDASKKLGTLDQALAGMATTASGALVPEGKEGNGLKSSETITIALHMQEEAGNEYQNMSIGSKFTIQVLATQYTFEEDSFDDQYDVNAVYPVSTPEEFAAALAAAQDGDIIDANGAAIGAYVGQNINKEVTLRNVNFTKGSAPDPIYGGNTTSDIEGTTFAKKVTFEDCTFDATDAIYCNTFEDGAVFENCELNGGWSAIYNNTTKGDVVIKDSTITAYAYAVNFGGGDGDNTLTIDNCDIKGWNSFGDTSFNHVVVKDTKFGKSSGYGVLRFYQDAEVTNCIFSDDFEFIDCNKGGCTITISGCTGITAAKIFNNGTTVSTWILDGTTLSGVASH